MKNLFPKLNRMGKLPKCPLHPFQAYNENRPKQKNPAAGQNMPSFALAHG